MWVGDHKVSFERESWLVLVVSVPLHAGGQTEQTHQRFRGSAQTRKITLRARRYLSRSFWHRIAFDVFPSWCLQLWGLSTLAFLCLWDLRHHFVSVFRGSLPLCDESRLVRLLDANHFDISKEFLPSCLAGFALKQVHQMPGATHCHWLIIGDRALGTVWFPIITETFAVILSACQPKRMRMDHFALGNLYAARMQSNGVEASERMRTDHFALGNLYAARMEWKLSERVDTSGNSVHFVISVHFPELMTCSHFMSCSMQCRVYIRCWALV